MTALAVKRISYGISGATEGGYQEMSGVDAMNDIIEDALNNLIHDNYEVSYSGSRNREADAGLIRAEIERLKAKRENTCMLCNMLEREVCAEQKVHLRAEVERLKKSAEEAIRLLRVNDENSDEIMEVLLAALAEKEARS